MADRQQRGREPPVFNGTQDFENWNISFLSWLALENVKYVTMCTNYLGLFTVDPELSDFDEGEITVAYDDPSITTPERDKAWNLCTRLFFYLHNFTEDPVRSMLVDVQLGGGVYNGLAAYRKVHARYRKTVQNQTFW